MKNNIKPQVLWASKYYTKKNNTAVYKIHTSIATRQTLIHSCNYIHTLDPTQDKYVHKIHDSVAGSSLYNQNHF